MNNGHYDAWAEGGGYAYGTARGYGPTRDEISERLQPLFSILAALDGLRMRMERSGGGGETLDELRGILLAPITLKGCSRFFKPIALVNPQPLRRVIADAAGYSVHLEARTLHHGIPVYYCCRTRDDYYSEYGLIVEDLYCSPSYPFDDERFVRLRMFGREEQWLRLSQYRSAVEQMLGSRDGDAVDAHLHEAGRWVLSAAWHESQRPGLLIAACMGLSAFPRAVEILHLALTSDPCDLRARVNPAMLLFFREAYKQKHIHSFLSSLQSMDGGRLDRIWSEALPMYRGLTSAYLRFIKTEIRWGPLRQTTPLWKVVFGNYPRMQSLSGALRANSSAAKAARELERTSAGILERFGKVIG